MSLNLEATVGDRLALAVVAQYRLVTTEQLHLLTAAGVRIEQTRRRLMKLREEGLVQRVTLPQAGRRRVWFATAYGVQVASEWPELRGIAAPRLLADPTAARLRVAHALTVSEVGLSFVQDARVRGDICWPLDWIPEVHHPLGGGEAVVPDALLFYRTRSGSMLRAFVEVDRATMGPERLAAKLTAYARLHAYIPMAAPGRHRQASGVQTEPGWRHRYPLFPRLLFVLDGTGAAGVDNRISALNAASRELEGRGGLLREVPVLAVSMTDLLQRGPSAPVWQPVQDPAQRVDWTSRPVRHAAAQPVVQEPTTPRPWPPQV
ncbi:replication-relaxation family protein [Streptomyces sp. NPDC059378]|uniref:replication-relaxation family protein n=1 Tax=Streptomyces sp. NPDC059378 TaxID=3346815 RepID=UPI0036C350D8